MLISFFKKNFKKILTKQRPPEPLTKRSGVSLVIAMVMVVAFMLMTADIMQSMVRSQNIAKGAKYADQAQLNAQLGLELGLYAQNKPKDFPDLIKAMNGGKDAVDNTISDSHGGAISWKTTDNTTGGEGCYEKTPTGNTINTMAGCDANKYFVYPYPGTGTAGGKYCDIKTQQLRKNTPWLEDMYLLINGKKYEGKIEDAKNAKGDNFVNGIADQYALDHPCLWNTLKKGESAEVPLFRLNSDGSIMGPGGVTDFYVRARLPCKNGVACEEGGRWKLLTTADNEPLRALIWNIVADCKTDTLCYLSELSTGTEKNRSVITYGIFGNPKPKPDIKNWILGYTMNQNIINGQDGSKEQNIDSLQNFLKNTGKWINASITKPFFHLSIAAPLTVANGAEGQTIDTIEYQIIYKQNVANTIPLITNPSVISQGTSGGYTTSLQSSLTKQTGSFNYSITGN